MFENVSLITIAQMLMACLFAGLGAGNRISTRLKADKLVSAILYIMSRD